MDRFKGSGGCLKGGYQMNDLSADVELARQGSTEAFSRLYSTVYRDLYHIALYCLRDPHDASDAVSDAVLDAFCNIKKLRSADSFRSWIMSILSAKIKRRFKERYSGDDIQPEEIQPFDYESVELREAISHLDSKSRLILSMAVLGGYTGREIAAVCKMKESSVRSRLSRIKEKLRIELSEGVEFNER